VKFQDITTQENRASKIGIKITIAKLLEIAYSKNKGLTTKIIRKKGNFKISINGNGKVKLHGSAGVLSFNGGVALEAIGAKVKFATIHFSKGEGQTANYKASFSFAGGVTSLSVTGTLNIEELITSCSGLLCQAARLLKGNSKRNEQRLKEIMEN